MPAKPLRGVDIITAGFPCQGMSVAGKRGGFSDDRSALFFEFIRVAKRLRPTWLLIENVPGLRSAPKECKGRDFYRVLSEMDELGYGVAWTSLDAQYFGLAQRRKRVFLVGYLGEEACPPEILFEPKGLCGDSPPSQEKGKEVAATIGASAPSRRNAGSCPTEGHLVAACLNSGGNEGGFRTEPGEHLVAHSLLGKPNDSHDESMSTYVVHARQDPVTLEDKALLLDIKGNTQAIARDWAVRRLTPREAERLQGFPDDWTQVSYRRKPMSDSARYRMLGLAVAVPVAQWILRRLKAKGAQTVGELFSGIGGFALAAQREGLRTLWASEICPQAQAVYKAHFPEIELVGDVRGLLKEQP